MRAPFRSLSVKVVAWALVFSTLFTLAMTAALVLLQYRAEQDMSAAQLRLAADNSSKAIAASLWELDMPAVRLQLDALSRYPGVGHVVLQTAIGQRLVAQRADLDLPLTGRLPTSLNVTLLSPGEGGREIGTLELLADEAAMWTRITRQGLRILAGEMLKGLLLAMLLVWLVDRLVMRHVAHIAQQAGAMSATTLDAPLRLERAAAPQEDELDQLCTAFNTRNADLADYIRRQQAMEEELRTHRDNLARMIDERTSSLLQTQQSLRRVNQELYELSRHDALTGIANRRHFDEVKVLEFRRAVRGELPLAVLMCDIDDFKAYNDAYGHAKGDECLQALGNCLRELVSRAGELPARLGGEEFAVLLPNTDREHAEALAGRLRAAVEALGIEHRASRAGGLVTVSIGVATLKPAHASFDMLLQDADAALYRAKEEGRNRVVAV